MIRFALALCLLATPFASHAAEPARVMIVGTYHFGNPGQDHANVESVDVTAPTRQAELQAISDALARFEPTLIGVEWPAGTADREYARYLEGTLPPTANEVVQLGSASRSSAGWSGSMASTYPAISLSNPSRRGRRPTEKPMRSMR